MYWAIDMDCAGCYLPGANATAVEAASAQAAAISTVRPNDEAAGGIGIVPIVGPVMNRRSALLIEFGVPHVSTMELPGRINQLANDDSISAILMPVDSPGGLVFNLPEAHKAIMAARAKKPVIAVVIGMAASAAYWIISAASEIVISEAAMAGSIGVVTYHDDLTKMLAERGINTTIIATTPEKVERWPEKELSDDAAAHMQSEVDTLGAMFIRDVAKGRGVDAATVRETFGKGRMLLSGAAKAAGMVDSIGTIDSTLSRLMKTSARVKRGPARAGSRRLSAAAFGGGPAA